MGEFQSLPLSLPCSTDLSILHAAESHRANNFLMGQNSAMFIYVARLITATFWWSPCVWQASAAVFWEAAAFLSPMHSPVQSRMRERALWDIENPAPISTYWNSWTFAPSLFFLSTSCKSSNCLRLFFTQNTIRGETFVSTTAACIFTWTIALRNKCYLKWVVPGVSLS